MEQKDFPFKSFFGNDQDYGYPYRHNTMSLTLTGVLQMRVGIDLIHALENMERNYGESSQVY